MRIRKVQDRGEETRKRLLDIAMRRFSESGFDGVSLRDIVAEAETTLPSVSYHFASKEGLYQAVLSEIAAGMTANLSSASSVAVAVLKEKDASREEKFKALDELLVAHARAVLKGSFEWSRLMIQEQTHPSVSASPLTLVAEKLVVIPLAALLADLLGYEARSPDARIEALFLIGKVFTFRAARDLSLRVMRWEDINPARIEQIVTLLRKDLRRLVPNVHSK